MKKHGSKHSNSGGSSPWWTRGYHSTHREKQPKRRQYVMKLLNLGVVKRAPKNFV